MSSYVRFRSTGTSVAVGSRDSLLGHGVGVGIDAGSQLSAPYGFTVDEATLAAPAPGVGNSYSKQLALAGVTTGSLVTLADANTSVRTALGVAIAAQTRHNVRRSLSGTPSTAVAIHGGWRYTVDSPNEDISFINAGSEADNITLAGTSRFFGLEGHSTAEGSATASARQVPWPISGVFVGLAIRASVSSSTAAQLWLRVAGSDTLLTISGINTTAITVFTAFAPVAVTAGDLVDFRYIRTSGSGTTFTCGAVLAFRGAV